MSTDAVSRRIQGGLSRRTVLAALAGVGAAALAGCTSALARAGRDHEVAVSVRNDDDRTHHVTLTFLSGDEFGPEPFAGVRLRYADGSERFDDADTLDEIPAELLADAVSFAPLGGAPVRDYETVRAASGVEDSVRLGDETWLVYVVAVPGEDEPLRTFGQVTCAPGGFDAVEIHVQDDERVAVSLGCRDETA